MDEPESTCRTFDTSVQNISLHIINILKDKELDKDSVIKYSLITAADDKQYNVMFYSLEYKTNYYENSSK
ncbi:MAG: hypothetical protein ACRDD8_11955 [Bacteroidales bacterium]